MATFVELFAGCGGMSLGLEAATHTMLMANELSPMAAESYSYNLLGVDIREDGFAKSPISSRRVLWLNSKYGSDDVRQRLDENPYTFDSTPQSRELKESDLTGKLIVGDIRQLNEYAAQARRPLLSTAPDMVTGGPPCQSFSMAGLRQFNNHRNRLPWEFAKFVEAHQPKLAILENVSGILRPFMDESQRVYAWIEVAKAFATIGYAPICLHVNAKDAGVAQNRPRFIMIAVRKECVTDVEERLGSAGGILAWGTDLVARIAAGRDISDGPHSEGLVDLTRPETASRYRNGVLAEFMTTADKPFTVADAIGDLHDEPEAHPYVEEINAVLSPFVTTRGRRWASKELANNEHRRHSAVVQARFRLYQRIEELAGAGQKLDELRAFMRDTDATRVPDSKQLRSLLFGDPLRNPAGREVRTENDVLSLIIELRTRKRTQKALRRGLPAPAALSIPDDACHYAEPRTLSVREMARIQSFPDNFHFRSVPTTGGARRKYQVPQYTQVGNAVPPKLAYALGRVAAVMLGEPVAPSKFPEVLRNSSAEAHRQTVLVD